MGDTSYEKPDFWSRKAFSEGYPARSVYKLKEIDEKFKMIKKGYTVLDLGASPGSWTMFILKKMEGMGKVVSCDLNPLSKDVKGGNLTFIEGDLLEESTRRKIQDLGPYDLVVCDAAMPTTGNRTVDTAHSESIVEMAIWYAQTMLHQRGNFAVKIFQSGSQHSFLQSMKTIFDSARGFKPKACRTISFETYLLGICRK